MGGKDIGWQGVSLCGGVPRVRGAERPGEGRRTHGLGLSLPSMPAIRQGRSNPCHETQLGALCCTALCYAALRYGAALRAVPRCVCREWWPPLAPPLLLVASQTLTPAPPPPTPAPADVAPQPAWEAGRDWAAGRALAKQLLAGQRENLQLWGAYAQLEEQAGKVKVRSRGSELFGLIRGGVVRHQIEVHIGGCALE